MNSRTLSGWLTAALLLARCTPAVAADDVTLLRVFLTDGSSLVSYGEPARIGDRVVFSMPTAATPNPPLHSVDLDRRCRQAPGDCGKGAKNARRLAAGPLQLPSD